MLMSFGWLMEKDMRKEALEFVQRVVSGAVSVKTAAKAKAKALVGPKAVKASAKAKGKACKSEVETALTLFKGGH